MSRSLRYIVAAFLTSLLSTSVGFSQSTFGSITGTVKDPEAATVPAAEVEVINEGTGTIRRATTSTIRDPVQRDYGERFESPEFLGSRREHQRG